MSSALSFRHPKATIVLLGALFASLEIAAAKFVAAAITGSSSMASEGIPSLVDSGNQILLFYGQRRVSRSPDARIPSATAANFWAFVVAILIFAAGVRMSTYEGWIHIRAPAPLRDPAIDYIILAIASLLEGASRLPRPEHDFCRRPTPCLPSPTRSSRPPSCRRRAFHLLRYARLCASACPYSSICRRGA